MKIHLVHSYPSPSVSKHGMDFTVQRLGLVATEVGLVP